jgi:hypothetical protein
MDRRTPLMTIAPGTDLASYRSLLRSAAAAAEARDASVQFDIVAVVPATGTLPNQVKAAEAAREQAAAVARELVSAGVPAERLHLQARTDPHASRADVRVYVR